MFEDRSPGWDRRAINRIAIEYYDGLEGMFEAHGWDRSGRTFGQIAPTRVVETYGSVESLCLEHPLPRLLTFQEALEADPPQVWIKSFYGFYPEAWGMLGYTQDYMRESFIKRTHPGVLVVVYAASKAHRDTPGTIIGIQQMTHETGDAREFMAPDAWNAKQANPSERDKWNDAIRVHRAWRVSPESTMRIEDFAPTTFSEGKRAQTIGGQGMPLTPEEAQNILKLDLQEVQVWRGPKIEYSEVHPASSLLKPSKAGPVSQTPKVVQAAEGPKHLYILELQGPADTFLGRECKERRIVKVGFSKSPQLRCEALNCALPEGQYFWKVRNTSDGLVGAPFDSSKYAIAGENTMKDVLFSSGESLGGEFFLADEKSINSAWEKGVTSAKEWKP